jgi:tRNA (mo5U34)-methyltransferase
MTPWTDCQLQDFQAALAWKTGYELPDGRFLGAPGKRGSIVGGSDARVRAVRDRFQPAGKRILEVGCCEGGLTVQLAPLCAEIVALDVRPANIVAALVRAFVHGVQNVRFGVVDVSELGTEFGTFDIVFHVGVLYHLADPAGHLGRIAALAPDLILDTHFADESLDWPKATVSRAHERYEGRLYREGDWSDAFSGVQPTSTWLMKDDLLRVLRDVGYESVYVLEVRKERNGPRITLIARRPASQAKRALPALDDAAGWRLQASALELQLQTQSQLRRAG